MKKLLQLATFVTFFVFASMVFAQTAATSGTTTDSTITSEVQKKLASDPMLSTVYQAITVYTSKAVVTLTGNVDTYDQKKAAVTDAESIKGVTSVNSDKLTASKPTTTTAPAP